MRYSDYVEDRQMWILEVNRLESFIKAYKPYINDLKCYEGHCSK